MLKFQLYVLSFRHEAQVCQTNRRTDRQTDGQNSDPQDRASIAASRGKNPQQVEDCPDRLSMRPSGRASGVDDLKSTNGRSDWRHQLYSASSLSRLTYLPTQQTNELRPSYCSGIIDLLEYSTVDGAERCIELITRPFHKWIRTAGLSTYRLTVG